MAVQMVVIAEVDAAGKPLHLFIEEGGPPRLYCSGSARVPSHRRKAFCVWDSLTFACPACNGKFWAIRKFWEEARKTGGTNGNEA